MKIGDKKHWEGIYESKSDAELSWHQDVLVPSFGLICEFAQPGDSVIDIGGGSPGGHLVLGTFALDGQDRCSGLPAYRYDAATLETLFQNAFMLRAQVQQVHRTPWGANQSFVYVVLERLPTTQEEFPPNVVPGSIPL